MTCDAAPASNLRLGATPSVLAFGVRATRPGRGLVMVRARDRLTGARAKAGVLVTVVGS